MTRTARSSLQLTLSRSALLLALSFICGCDAVSKENTSFSQPSSQSPSIVVMPATAQIRVGDTQLFAAATHSPQPVFPIDVRPHSGANIVRPAKPDVTWSVDDIPGGNATVGTIDAKGLYTAPTNLPNPNSVKVTATSTAEPSAAATVPVTLENPIPIVTSISPTTVSVGSFTLTVTGRGFVKGAQIVFAGTPLQTAFNSATQLIATGAATQAQVGNLQIAVKNPDPGSASSTTVFYVKVSPPPAIQVWVSPVITTLRAMDIQQFTAMLKGTSNSGVTWSVNGVIGGNTTLGTISPNGLYIAPATLPNSNSLDVTATSAAEPSVSATASVTLENPVPVLISVSPTTVTVGSFALTVDGSKFVKGAQVLFAGTALQTTFNSSTRLTAIGTATQAQVGNMPILVMNPDPGSASSTAALYVQGAAPHPAIHVLVSPSKMTLEPGHIQQFTVTVQGTTNSAVNWSVGDVASGNATLGTINRDGLYTAPATIPNSSPVSVTATSVADARSSGTALIALQIPAASGTTNYYVNGETGDDSYDGLAPEHTSGSVGPWLTLRKAGLTATAGSTVHVADGTYNVNGTVGSVTSIETKNSGTPNAWITYLSDHKWGAKIVNTNSVNGPDNIAWVVEGDYQIVKDFDISGGPYTGIFVDGNHVQLIGNHLHDISSDSCLDGSFIYVNSPHQYVDTVGNVMHDGGMNPWPSDCVDWHGIYYGGVTTGPVQYGQISNNIIYRVSGWGIHFWHKVSHIDVVNNLIFSNVHGGILIGASDGSTNDYFNVNNNMVIYNSNMFDNTGGPSSLGWGISQYMNDGGQIGPHNSYLNNLVYENHASNGWGGNWANQAAGTNPRGVISGTVTADPFLVNYQNSPAVPTISNGKIEFLAADYHPTPTSPAKNAGDGTIEPPTDIDGAARSQGAACNIGPY